MYNDHYQLLHKQSQQDPQWLGVRLPAMTQAELEISSLQCSAAEICEHIQQLQATQGWVMYRDSIALTSSAPERNDFIEGEWCNEHTSIKVKYLHSDTYLCVSMSLSNQGAQPQQYTEQVIFLRKDLSSAQDNTAKHNAVIYRQWFEQAQTGDAKGRWLPLMQQFMGFTHSQSASHASSKEPS
jgi:hypothetical protein